MPSDPNEDQLIHELSLCLERANAGDAASMRRAAEIFELRGQITDAIPWWYRAAIAGDPDAVLYLREIFKERTYVMSDFLPEPPFVDSITDIQRRCKPTGVSESLPELRSARNPDGMTISEIQEFLTRAIANGYPDSTRLRVRAKFSGKIDNLLAQPKDIPAQQHSGWVTTQSSELPDLPGIDRSAHVDPDDVR